MSHQVYDKEGKLIDATIVPDGGMIKVPFMMMDTATPDIAAITRAAMINASDVAMHRPGTMATGGGIQSELAALERQTQRNYRLDALSDQWRNPPAADAMPARIVDAADPDAAADARDQRLRDAWVNA